MNDDTSQGQDDSGKIGVNFRRSGEERQRLALQYVEPAKAAPLQGLPVIQQPRCSLTIMVELFLKLWVMRTKHGVAIKPNAAWERAGKLYGALVDYKLPLNSYRFYYVENDEGRSVLILPMVTGNLSVCYRVVGDKFCVDYIIPNIGFKHPSLGTRGEMVTDHNFIIGALSDLHDRLVEPPDFKPIF